MPDGDGQPDRAVEVSAPEKARADSLPPPFPSDMQGLVAIACFGDRDICDFGLGIPADADPEDRAARHPAIVSPGHTVRPCQGVRNSCTGERVGWFASPQPPHTTLPEWWRGPSGHSAGHAETASGIQPARTRRLVFPRIGINHNANESSDERSSAMKACAFEAPVKPAVSDHAH